jgi:multiple sugar transport system ATP-binding protein
VRVLYTLLRVCNTIQITIMTIKIGSLRKEFDTPNGVEVAVNNVNLEIGRQEFVTLVGPSGCGKTTTLRCAAGLEMPTSGKVFLNDEDVTKVPANKRGLAMMFQNIALYPHMNVRDNISYPLKVQGIPKTKRDKEAKKGAEIMQIPELLDKYPAELSGGQRQRAALARTIVQDPQAFLMDEPLSDLDAQLKVEIRKEIQRVHKRVERPTLYVTHDQEEAMTMSDRIAVMNDGNIEQIGTPDELYTRPRNMFVAQFIGNPSMNFMRGSLDSFDDGTITATFQGNHIEFSTIETENEDKTSDIVIGFRPEIINLDSNGTGYFDGTISLIERISDQIQATVDGPDGELRATVSADHSLSENEATSISFDRERTHIFDSETGEAIAHGSKA